MILVTSLHYTVIIASWFTQQNFVPNKIWFVMLTTRMETELSLRVPNSKIC